MLELKLKIVEWLLHKMDYSLIFLEPKGEHRAGVVGHGDCDNLGLIMTTAMEQNKDYQTLILNGARGYLKQYEIDARNFALEIYPTKNL